MNHSSHSPIRFRLTSDNKKTDAIAALTNTFANVGTLIPVRDGYLDMKVLPDVSELLTSHAYGGSRIGHATLIEWSAVQSSIQEAALASKSNAFVDKDKLPISRIILSIRPLLSQISDQELADKASSFIITCNNSEGSIGHRFSDGFQCAADAYDKQAMQAYIKEWLFLLRKVCPRAEVEDCNFIILLLETNPNFCDALVENMINFIDYIFDFIDQNCEPIY